MNCLGLPYPKKETMKLISDKCVNSKWPAKFLAGDKEYCQCNFECKVRVLYRGYEYIVTEKELDQVTVAEPEEVVHFHGCTKAWKCDHYFCSACGFTCLKKDYIGHECNKEECNHKIDTYTLICDNCGFSLWNQKPASKLPEKLDAEQMIQETEEEFGEGEADITIADFQLYDKINELIEYLKQRDKIKYDF